jgi:hypothetical protein
VTAGLGLVILAAVYRAPFGLTVNARARYVGDTFQDISNEAFQDAHWIFDLYASYQVLRHFQVFFGITNICDEKYIADGFGQSLGAPRQVSGELRARFWHATVPQRCARRFKMLESEQLSQSVKHPAPDFASGISDPAWRPEQGRAPPSPAA